MHYLCLFSRFQEALSQIIEEAIAKVVYAAVPTDAQVYAFTLLKVWTSLLTLRICRFGLEFIYYEQKSYSMSLWLMLVIFCVSFLFVF